MWHSSVCERERASVGSSLCSNMGEQVKMTPRCHEGSGRGGGEARCGELTGDVRQTDEGRHGDERRRRCCLPGAQLGRRDAGAKRSHSCREITEEDHAGTRSSSKIAAARALCTKGCETVSVGTV